MRKQLSFSMGQQADKENQRAFNHSNKGSVLNYLEIKKDKKVIFISILSEVFAMSVKDVELLATKQVISRAVYSKKKRIRKKYRRIAAINIIQRLLEIRQAIEKQNRKVVTRLEKDEICRECQRKGTCWCSECINHESYIE